MLIEEELKKAGSKIPDLGKVEDPYLGDYSCWSSKVVFFKANDILYFYEGWEMNLSDCTRVTIVELMKRNVDLILKLNSIKSLI